MHERGMWAISATNYNITNRLHLGCQLPRSSPHFPCAMLMATSKKLNCTRQARAYTVSLLETALGLWSCCYRIRRMLMSQISPPTTIAFFCFCLVTYWLCRQIWSHESGNALKEIPPYRLLYEEVMLYWTWMVLELIGYCPGWQCACDVLTSQCDGRPIYVVGFRLVW
jgi:hypothetical protein